MLISTKSKVIKYLSHCCYGKKHDFSLLKKEFPKIMIGYFNPSRIKIKGHNGGMHGYQSRKIER